MIDTVLSWTELPNLHPLFVHFPIALVTLGVLLELGGLVRRRAEWLDRAAVTVWIAAGLGAWASLWAGERAADSLAIPPEIQGHVNTHSDWGHYTVYLVGAVALSRLAVSFWRPAPRDGRLWPGVFLVAGLAAFGITTRTADLGGGLVYQHGLAVQVTEDGDGREARRTTETEPREHDTTESRESPPAASEALKVSSTGRMTWTPVPEVHDIPAPVLTGPDGSAPRALEVATEDAPGLPLAIDGSGLALLPDPCGDAQIEADLTLDGFEGTLGLAHHVRSVDDAGLFTLTFPEGPVRLVTVAGGERRILGEDDHTPPEAKLTAAVSAATSHFRGMVDGELLVHGHGDGLPDGRCGLYYDGVGTFRIHEMRVIPVGD